MRRLTALFASLVALVLAFGVVGSAAWFTDQDTLPVTGTTGQIEFVVGGPHHAGITLTNLLPGVFGPQYAINAYNTAQSTTAVKYRITDSFTSESEPGLFNLLWVRVRHTHCGTIAPAPAAWPIVWEGFLKDLDVQSPIHAIVPTLGINITHCYQFEFALAHTAGNVFQDESVAFNLVFDATQPENPGWAE
jgi:predicted ribosomally synthesized peptide with SipW-like signal peptide